MLVSPHRTDRPWQGEVNKTSGFSDVHYDPQCYLCPGNTRAGGKVTPKYDSVYVFDNDYAALLPDSPEPHRESAPEHLRAERERGRCRVVCFHPDHSLTLARMRVADIRKVVDAWTEEYKTLGAEPDFRYVQIFENRGAMMGASNPHPAWTDLDDRACTGRTARGDRVPGCLAQEPWELFAVEYARLEGREGARVVEENGGFLAVVPWWAVWPLRHW